MFRGTLLHLSYRRWLRRWMEESPLARKLTRRFIAGATIEDGVRVLERLARERISGTLDHLGENVTSLEEAARSRDAYLRALEEIERARLPATVSIKLTQLGLDFSEDACLENVFAVAGRAAAAGSGIEIDMESSVHTARTLRLVAHLHENFAGHVRAVIQACLFRSEADIRMLSSRGIPVRLCKGAYEEPASAAFLRKADVDANYVKLMELLLAEGTDPAIATHDEKIIRLALHRIGEQTIAPDRFEFQMLYGIRRDLQRELVSEGFRLRLYVPCGSAWFPYFMRRLAERPANVLFLARNLLRG
ncbi:MAG: proline dehydrogenase family protein [Bryobacteraceae bacterium]